MTIPKAHFLADKVVADTFQNFADSVVFTKACEAAMLEVVESLSDTKLSEPVASAAAYQQLLGARRFMVALSMIGLPRQPMQHRSDPGTLDHTA